MSEIERGQFGEPWEPEERHRPLGRGMLGHNLDVDGHPLTLIGDYVERRHRDRAIACVNALDGMRPEGLAAVLALLPRALAAVRHGIAYPQQSDWLYIARALTDLDGLLAGLMGKEETHD